MPASTFSKKSAYVVVCRYFTHPAEHTHTEQRAEVLSQLNQLMQSCPLPYWQDMLHVLATKNKENFDPEMVLALISHPPKSQKNLITAADCSQIFRWLHQATTSAISAKDLRMLMAIHNKGMPTGAHAWTQEIRTVFLTSNGWWDKVLRTCTPQLTQLLHAADADLDMFGQDLRNLVGLKHSNIVGRFLQCARPDQRKAWDNNDVIQKEVVSWVTSTAWPERYSLPDAPDIWFALEYLPATARQLVQEYCATLNRRLRVDDQFLGDGSRQFHVQKSAPAWECMMPWMTDEECVQLDATLKSVQLDVLPPPLRARVEKIFLQKATTAPTHKPQRLIRKM